MFWLIDYSFGQVCQQKKQNKMTTQDEVQMASVLCAKSFPNTAQ